MSRLVFLGSPDAAVVSLTALVESGHDLCMVITQPDKRRGRGSGVEPSPVKGAAVDLGIPVSHDLAPIAGLGAELGVVVAYGRIIPQAVLDVLPMINAHFSLLPRWRGAAPVERAILAGDGDTGICVMRLEAGLDTGPVLARRRLRIDNNVREHAGALTARLAAVGAELLVDMLGGGVAGLPAGEAQHGEPTYAAKIDAAELELQWSCPAQELERVVRLDRAWTTFRGERLGVFDAVARDAPGDGVEAGVIEGCAVRCAQGALELVEVQPAGKRRMAVSAWLQGVRLTPGERLGEA